METRTRLLLLSIALACWRAARRRRSRPMQRPSLPIPGRKNRRTCHPRVIEPEVARREIKVAKIDASNIELGGYYGSLSIEDFGTNAIWGANIAYHVTEDFFFQGSYGRSRAGKTSYEALGGNVQLLTPAQRRFTYYDLSLGYNIFPGEVYIGRNLAMNSALYVIGGIAA